MDGLRTNEKNGQINDKKNTQCYIVVDVNRELTEQISTVEVMWIMVFPMQSNRNKFNNILLTFLICEISILLWALMLRCSITPRLYRLSYGGKRTGVWIMMTSESHTFSVNG